VRRQHNRGRFRQAGAVTFELYPLRFHFAADDTLQFPRRNSSNMLRGALGAIFRKISCAPQCENARTCARRAECAYARMFEPASLGIGPSGLADWPRPFVFRAGHLNMRTIPAGGTFHLDLNLFLPTQEAIGFFAAAFAELAHEGLGPRRRRARLDSVSQLDSRCEPLPDIGEPLSLNLRPGPEPVTAVRVEFATATELKTDGGLAQTPTFDILFARIRDRISTLRGLYGAGPLNVDFKGMSKRAAAIRIRRFELFHASGKRTSSRTGQTHPLGGFIGSADYEGDLAEFIPYLEAAQWTGVGRQTVWGNGQIRLARK
jgi:hypothetical protein